MWLFSLGTMKGHHFQNMAAITLLDLDVFSNLGLSFTVCMHLLISGYIRAHDTTQHFCMSKMLSQ